MLVTAHTRLGCGDLIQLSNLEELNLREKKPRVRLKIITDFYKDQFLLSFLPLLEPEGRSRSSHHSYEGISQVPVSGK